MSSRTFRTIVLSALLLVAGATAAQALNIMIINNNNNNASTPLHLVSSVPYDRQTLDTPPPVVSFTFSQPIKPDKSWIRVYSLTGGQLDVGELQSGGTSMSVTLPELTAGKYTIKWRARCQCTDDTEISDSFHFTVQ